MKMVRNSVLLYYPKTYHEENYRFYWIPYSLLAVSTYISQKKFDVKIIDGNTGIFIRNRNFVKNIIEKSKIVGISAMIGKQILDGIEFAKYVKEINPNATIVWGGYSPTLLPDLFINHKYVDVVVQGQGELTFLELCERLFSNRPLRNIKGIIYKTNGKTIYNPRREIINLNERPPYPFSLINVQQYIRNDSEINTRTINYVSSQGCPFRCGFCSEVAMYRNRWLYLSAERMVNDIKYLYDKYQINGIKFYDPNFFANKPRVFQLIDLLEKNNIEIKWAASAHPNNLSNFNDEEWKALKRSGCSRILIGAESGDQNILDMINKRTTVNIIRKVAKKLSQFGIIGSFTFVVGFPGESDSSVKKTIKFAEELLSINDKFEAKIHFYLPYPGTPLYPKALSYGFRPPMTLEEWGCYDYYKIETPWVDKNLYEVIRRFNEEYCPYVQKILTGDKK
jgi:radical SAM superfamily enzyme YgiQ (UPF0313 family)